MDGSMFLNSWSLGLTLAALVVLLLALIAGRTALLVLRHWDPSSDSDLQIRLENGIWLTSTLVEYGLGFQVLTLVLFVLAADTWNACPAREDSRCVSLWFLDCPAPA